MGANRLVYADNAATTAVSPAVLEAMYPLYQEYYGNPSSIHSVGRAAKTRLENARRQLCGCINADPAEIYFTGSGTESDNWALRGAASLMKQRGKTHIITSAFEHHAVLHTLESLEKEGFTVTMLDVHSDGLVRGEELEAAITPQTGLATIVYANNEIGTIQPVAALGAICRERGILFHTDAVQAAGQLPIDVRAQNIDMLSLSAHKLYGPKGVGALYLKSSIPLPRLLTGGVQERGLRAGTENVPGIVGMATAFELSCRRMEEHTRHVTALRDRLTEGLLTIEGSCLNGHPACRLPGNVNISFPGVEGESLLLMLDMQGICASSGSACTSGSLEASHVLMALGISAQAAKGSLRLSLGQNNTEADVDYILEILPPIVEKLRTMGRSLS